ncbi:MAG: TolC family protein [Gammaproteobacteria bacterium]
MFLISRTVAQAVVWIAMLLLAASAFAGPTPSSIPWAPLTLAQAASRLMRVNPGILGAQQKQEVLWHQAVAAAQLPDPEIGLMAENFPANNPMMPSQGPNAMLSLGISQRLPPFGQRQYRSEELQEKNRAAFYGIATTRAESLLALRLAWFDAISTKQALWVLRTQRDLETESVQAALARFRAGFAPESDVLQAQLGEQALANRVAQVRALHAAARARIAELLNAMSLPELAADWPAIPKPPALETIESDLSGNPVLRQSQAIRHAAERGVEVAKSEYYPDITVLGSYGNSYYPGMPNTLTIGIRFSLPIFTSRRQDQVLDAARAKARASGYEYQEQSLSMLRRVRTLFAQYASTETQLQRTQRVLLPTAKAAFAAALAAYTTGETDMTNLLRAQRSVLEYSLAGIQLHREFVSAQAELDYLATQVEQHP